MADAMMKVEELSAAKKALLEKLLREKQAKAASFENEAIPRSGNEGGRFPLSFVQERIWFVDRLFHGHSVNNMAGLAEIRGPLVLERLIAGFRTVLGRHHALRSRFAEEDGVPFGRVADAVDLPFEVIDLSDLTEDDRAYRMREVMRDRIAAPFDLSVAPVLRLTFFKHEDDHHTCFLAIHHIVADGWSTKLFFNETIACYVAAEAGSDPKLAPLALQYEDFAYWQREHIRGAYLKEQIAWWKTRLDGAQTTLKLLELAPRTAERSWRGKRLPFMVDADLGAALRDRSRAQGVTLFSTLLAALQLLLGRYGDQDDLLVGIPVLGRPRPETMHVIGCFINTVVVRGRIDPNASWGDFVKETHRHASEAVSGRPMPFEKLVEALPGTRDVDRSPLVQVYFSFEEKPDNRLSVDKFHIAFDEYESDVAAMELTLEANQADDGSLECWFNYGLDYFSERLVEDLARGYLRILHEAARLDSARPLCDIDPMDGRERERILASAFGAPYGRERNDTLHGLFAARAAERPDATALIFGETRVSYRALDAASNRVAQLLLSREVARGTIVGLRFERSVRMVEAMLGVLKAGAAYLPLDPSFPAERTALMLVDAAVPLVLTDLDDAFDPGDAELLRLDRLDLASYRAELPAVAVSPDDLCYVIYTSGSTGTPKGTLTSHRNVHRIVRDNGYLELRPDDILLNLSNYAFDGSVFDIFGALSNGCALVLVDKDTLLDFDRLLDTVVRERVSAFFITTALFNQLVDFRLSALGGVRRILFGGEKASVAHVRAALDYVGPGVLANVYGPTETTVFATWHPVDWLADDAVSIPIGKPIADTSVYVLDSRLGVVPDGVNGELFIGGSGLSRGYLNRDDLTAERFVPNPFGEGRLYKTGDIVRRNERGELEYVSRADGQIKLRGFRVETGEVAHALRAVAGVRDAFVMAREDTPGNARLVAYVVVDPAWSSETTTAATLSETLSAALSATLPDFMIPSAFVRLDELPLNANGKVDRRALPAPAAAVGGDRVLPRTPEEARFADIVRSVLKIEEVALSDHFFDLGGHSLLATNLIGRLKEAYGVALPIRSVFEKPVLLDLWQELRRHAGADSSDEEPIPLQARGGRFPLSPAQERLWFLYQYEDDQAVYNMPSVLRFNGDVDLHALKRALEGVVARHEILRTVYGAEEGRGYQVIRDGFELEVPLIDFSAYDAAERRSRTDALIRLDARTPFDLEKGPVIRSSAVKWSEDEHYVLLNMHHIASDGWSIGVLIRELGERYRAEREGRPPLLPPLPLQYADYAVWQRERVYGESPETDAELRYWLDELSGELPALEIKGDRPRPVMQRYEGARVPVVIDAELTGAAAALARTKDATLFMVLLGAYAALLASYGNQSEAIVGVPAANRTRSDLDALIGFFVNTLPIRVDLADDPSFSGLLERVKAKMLGAYAHQGVPFERIVEELRLGRDTSRSPVFQHLLVLQNVPGGALELPGVTAEMLETDSGTAKFDLTLTLEEKNGGLIGYIEYATALYDAAFVEELFAHFLVLLREAVAAPDRAISTLELTLPIERELLLNRWASFPAEYPRDKTVADLWIEQVARTPDRVAVRCGDERLSYAELDARADAIAAALASRGVCAGTAGCDRIIGLYFERGIPMLAAILGVVKSGGAYLPLEPDLPADRVAFMVEDSGARVVLCSRERMPDAVGAAEVVALEDVVGAAGAESVGAARSPADLLYVIYTSGTTGNPKGVMITHENVVRLMVNDAFQFDFDHNDVWTLYHSYNFDFSVWEMYGAFLYGGTLVVVPKMTARDPAEFRRLLRDEKVTVLNQTPQAFYQLAEVEEAAPDHDLSVRTVIFGGEALSPARLKSWKASYRACKLINMYGITETTVHVTYKEIGDQEIQTNLSNIGTVIPTLSSYVMNAGLRLVPVGVPGELCVGGAGVARGYLNRPELSSSRFVENPYKREERLYRSGDLVRRLPSGDMEYLGRIDHQVKIRGFRIELDEIKNRLLQVDGVVDALVMDKTGPSGGKFLCAYYTCKGEVGAALLKERLHAWLPDYMVPSYFIKLDAFPLTANGKVDRRRLPDIDAAESTTGEYVEASDDRERRMAEIWKEILKRERVGAADNFFEIGGDSILAMQVVAKANQAGIFITVRDVFQYQTVRDIVAHAAQEASLAGVDFADQGPVTGSSPLTAIQERFFQTETAAPAYYNQAFLLDVREELDVFALAGALQAVVDHHDVLRSRFVQNEDGAPWGAFKQEFLPPGTGVSFDIQDISGLNAQARRARVYALGAAAQASFDLATGPLIKAVLMSFGAAEHQLFIAAHHLIVDGVSWRVIMQDLGIAYGAARAGSLTVLPPKTVSYRRWAELSRERARARAEELAVSDADGLAYWKALVATPVARVQRDGNGGGNGAWQNRYGSVRTLTAALDAEETAVLLTELPKAQRVAVNEAVAAAVARAFLERTGASSLRVDLEGHGRDQEPLGLDVSRTVGWFTAVYPAALEVPPGAPWGELLASVKEALRKAAERGFEYGLLSYLAPEGEARRVCRSIEPAELLFNYLGQFASSMDALSANMTMSADPIAPVSAPENERPHAFEINAIVMADRLSLDLLYSTELHAEATARGLLDDIVRGLRELVAFARSGEETRYAPSDFAAADLDAEDLAAILKNL